MSNEVRSGGERRFRIGDRVIWSYRTWREVPLDRTAVVRGFTERGRVRIRVDAKLPNEWSSNHVCTVEKLRPLQKELIEEPKMCEQDWLVEYEALRDRPPSPDHLMIAEYEFDDLRACGVDIIMPDGDHIATFYGSQGSEPPQDPRRNALLFVRAWEAAHE